MSITFSAMKKGLISKGAFKNISEGHPWMTPKDVIDRTHIPKRPSAYQFAERWWLCSPESFLRLRRLGPPQEGWMRNQQFNTITNADQFYAYFGPWMLEHFASTLKTKIAELKLDLATEDLCLRWIFSENDQLPGLIVDVFGQTVVAQINSAPVEIFWINIRKALIEAFQRVTQQEAKIIELRNAPVRQKEGLEVIAPAEGAEQILRWNGLKWIMTPSGTQKTGAYFDQRENHRLTAHKAKEARYKTAWDLCSYQGGFSLPLLQLGLTVTAVDQSAAALEIAQRNRELNNLSAELFKTECADIFEWLKEQDVAGAKVDLIILDPPSFVRSRQEIEPALKGYKELNRLALSCLKPGGMLVSCVCSHHISRPMYLKLLQESAQLTTPKSKIKVIDTQGPSADHKPAKGFKEGDYLHAWYVLKS